MNFRDIPPKDINYIISHYKLPSQGNKYLTVWNFIIQNKDVLIPKSIATYITNYNNSQLINQLTYLPEEVVVKVLTELDVDSLLHFCSSNVKK